MHGCNREVFQKLWHLLSFKSLDRGKDVYLRNSKLDYLGVLEKVGGSESLGGSKFAKILKAEFGV